MDPGQSTAAAADLQLLVPIRNEDDNVVRLHQALTEAAVDFCELCFLYDRDEDSILPFVERVAAQDPRVRAEKSGYGQGVVNVLRWGFAHVRPGPVVVVMGDVSDDVSQIPRMVSAWRGGATIVAPSRHLPGGGKVGASRLKGSLSWLAGRSLAWMGFPSSDPTNNFKLYDGAWLRQQTIESRGGFEIALELCYKAYRQGRTLAEFPTVWRERDRGTSKFRLGAWLSRYWHWYWLCVVARFRGNRTIDAKDAPIGPSAKS